MQLVTQAGDLGPKWFHISLRSLTLMAESNSHLKSNKIAELFGEDPTYIRKIFAKLSKAGILETLGGRYGGYRLKKNPKDITVKSVYNAFANGEPTPYWSVPSTESELFISLLISKAEKEFQSILEKYTIEDILQNTSK